MGQLNGGGVISGSAVYICLTELFWRLFYQNCLPDYLLYPDSLLQRRTTWCCFTFSDSALGPAHVALCRLLLSGRVKAIFLHLFSILDGKSGPPWLLSKPHPYLLFADAAIRPHQCAQEHSSSELPRWSLKKRWRRIPLGVSASFSSSFSVCLSFLFRLGHSQLNGPASFCQDLIYFLLLGMRAHKARDYATQEYIHCDRQSGHTFSDVVGILLLLGVLPHSDESRHSLQLNELVQCLGFGHLQPALPLCASVCSLFRGWLVLHSYKWGQPHLRALSVIIYSSSYFILKSFTAGHRRQAGRTTTDIWL